MKGLFKSKPRTPVEVVHQTRELLIYADKNTETRERKREEKMSELSKLILEMRTVLFGNGQNEPNSDACAQLTQEFFKENTFHLLIICLPKLDLGTRQNATHVIANLQRQRVNGRMTASEFMENNLDFMDILLPGYLDGDIALTYGAISRECIRINLWLEYNSQLLESTNYITRRHAVKLLGDMLLERSNSAVMIRYVSSLDNMRILMNLFRDSKKTIQLETFHVFKLFIANQSKPPEIISVLVTNKSKLLRFFGDFNIDKDDEQFEADKAEVIREIATLEIRDHSCADSEDSGLNLNCFDVLFTILLHQYIFITFSI
ncbi:hypothetical protein GH714_016089 [Hevea brasiliensis]|uniref:MO25-like protein At5g47540 n=1 Tax=Hevea brasiliensis TaxID=3981 RepID=A0A6A6LXT0_HEVBR|nr:hypothetical protein GH714_016089 [Hevea brasiliensis]